MNGLSFLFPGFLLGLTALAVPVILHLIDRRTPKRFTFSSIQFIRQASHHRVGKKRVRDWLVLLARLLTLAAVVLLFAAPVVARKIATTAVRDDAVVLFFDLSLSMNNEGFTDFIRDGVEQVILDHPNARYGIIASSNKVEKILPFGAPATDISDVISDLKPTFVEGSHYDGFMELAKLLGEGRELNKKVYIFSDLQSRDWSPSTLPNLNLKADIRFLTPEHSNQPNLAVLNVVPEVFITPSAKRARANVLVHNFSIAPRSATLQLSAGNLLTEQDISVRGEHSEKFVIDIENPPSNIAVVGLEIDEPMKLDNDYHFWIGPQLPLKILVIVESDSADTRTIESFFLDNALSLSVPGARRFETTIATPEFLWDNPLDTYECVFLLDSISTYSETEMAMLRAIPEAGGIVVYVAGKQAPENVVKLHRAGLTTARFVGFQGQEASRHRSFTISSFLKGAPVVTVFEDQLSDLFQFPIYKFAQIAPSAASRTLLSIGDSYPFLIEEQVGKGSCYLFTVAFSPRWSEFPTAMVFLPILRRVVEYGGEVNERGVISTVVGQDATGKLVAAGLQANVRIERRPGVQLVQGVPVEVNLTRGESDLRAVEEFSVVNHLTGGNVDVAMEEDPGNQDQTLREPLRKPLAVGLLSFFALELILSNRRKK